MATKKGGKKGSSSKVPQGSKHYATTRRGKVKTKIGGQQDQLLHARDLPHSHVTVGEGGKKSIKRYGTKSSKKK